MAIAILASLVLLPAFTWAQGTTSPGCSSAGLAQVADSIAAAFDAHQFVFLGSTHGGKKPHDLLLCLLSRPGFQRRTTDVLVEWANPVHQKLVDRYLLALEPVPLDSLRPVWLDTDAPQLWGRLPLIPEFYAAVRSINRQLDPRRRIRVLGGCEPIHWASVRSAADVATYPYKNNWAAHVIAAHFAGAAEKRLLVVYGDGHNHHNGGPMMSDLESRIARDRLFVIGTISDASDAEHVARLGDRSRPFYLAAGQLPSQGPYPRDLFYAREDPLAAHVDAVVYLGPEPDRNLSNRVELSMREQVEVARRDSIKGDLRQLMQLRLGNRDRWFRLHPNDLPRDPRESP